MEGRIVSFAKFRLDVGTGELFREGRVVRLAPQPTKLLLLLTRSAGSLVTHEEIHKELWGEDTFVDFEQAVKKCVKQVRAALGDDAEQPMYVETVPRRGYRFIGSLGVDGEASPYPGLSSFVEKDARFFYGREGEAEALWNKIERRNLLALIGPSGVGKSSFLRAGLVPSRREGWRVEVVTPGNAPLSSLPSREGETGAFLLVVDAFEELFTRNPAEVQKEYSERLGSLSREKDTHVLLSMRDDFLFRCHEQESLHQVFLDITPLGPLSGTALRLALEKPATECGYRFEEGLVEDMVREVEKLPLLAFATAQLWEKRDWEKKILTRAAYEEIGRAGGALAQHAERTLQSIGPERQSMVREIFRNLTTSQGTRVSMGKDELLSIFPDPDVAGGVLRQLIDARLLTSSESGIEIVHESLLTAWPRLTQWQAQDAEGTVLRDQLRHAVRLWDERGRTDDLLWTGTAFRDLTVWRERRSYGLTATEEEFAAAARRLAGRRRVRKRVAVAAGFAILLAFAGIVTIFWRRSVLEASRREAAQLLALGRLELEDSPTKALAYALASLERADNDAARRFAVDALWHGAAAVVLEGAVNAVDFSPDGRWLATGGVMTGVRLWSREGGPAVTLGEPDEGTEPPDAQFSPEGDFLVSGGEKSPPRFWSMPEGQLAEGTPAVDAGNYFQRGGKSLVSFMRTSEGASVFRDWEVRGGLPRVSATIELADVDLWNWAIDSSGEWLVTARGESVYATPLSEPTPERTRLLGKHSSKVVYVKAHPAEPRIFSGDETGEIRIWSLTAKTDAPLWTFQASGPQGLLDPTSSWMVVTPFGSHGTSDVARVWDLRGPPDAEPFALRNGDVHFQNHSAIHPAGTWLATANAEFGVLWPLHSKFARVLRSPSASEVRVAFVPDGSDLVSSSANPADRTVRLWPLSPRQGRRSRILMSDEASVFDIAVDAKKRQILVANSYRPRVSLVPLDGGVARLMPGFTDDEGWVFGVAFSPDGRLAVAAGNKPARLRIWDLASGALRILDTSHARTDICFGDEGSGLDDLAFLDDHSLLTVGNGGIEVWDIERAVKHNIRPCAARGLRDPVLAIDRARRHATVVLDARLTFVDVEHEKFYDIGSHGSRLSSVALDPTGTIVVTGDLDGVVRVGPVTGEAPHLLFGHKREVTSVAVSPDGKWIASGSQDGTIRLWPMPEGTPFHTLPYEEILKRIRSFTNLRVVPDEASETGYRVEVGPFPGWKTLPTW